MMNPAFLAVWNPPQPATSAARAAFATLAPARQRLLEAVLFDAWSCTELARFLRTPAADIRAEVSAAMRDLRAALIGDSGPDGAVAAMLVLRALEALDDDEAELVDAMLAHQPALQRAYADDCELVGTLCMMALPADPAPDVLLRLTAAIDADLPN